ncbi:TetR/AcrR family transcriptional regulator [Actinoallomurus soli]|uniref:TetR/AcrR family transcriptional regulator n=1 Tax=Actinoallomurus soli TaxID=2952535 RepID=UPI00209212B2|nr:TetR/AcrR family transcriptional regulator [Actinoallomurus soli]MCO5967859.1 TetR/AcrR family transcriptional regulator [Actinoallomurus soli]
MTGSEMRVYGGMTGADRRAERRAQLIEAALDLLGGAEEDQLTVRRVCRRAGLTPRYFYESFADRDELVAAVHEHVAQSIAATTLAAVEAAGARPEAKIRAGIEQLVRAVAGDPRHGRVLFSVTLTDPLLARRRLESSRFFARLLGGQARRSYGIPDGPRLELIAQFLVGGLAQTLTAWLAGALPMSEEEVVTECVGIFTALADRDPRTSG